MHFVINIIYMCVKLKQEYSFIWYLFNLIISIHLIKMTAEKNWVFPNILRNIQQSCYLANVANNLSEWSTFYVLLGLIIIFYTFKKSSILWHFS